MEVSFSKEDLRQRLRWYIGLRWFIVGALGLTGALPQFLQEGFVPQVRQNLSIALFALVLNIIFLAVSASHKRQYRAYRALAVCQLALDVFIMTCAVHYNGGIENIVAMLYIIPIIMSGALLGRRAIYATGLAAALSYDLLLILDYKGIIVSQGIIAPELHANTNYLVQTLFFAPAMLLTITAIIDFVARFIRERTELAAELRVVSAQRAETEAIIKTMGAALVAVDMQASIKTVNNSFEELTGWKRQEVVGANLDDILPLLDENGQKVKAEEHPLLQMLNAPSESQTPEVKHMSKYYFSRKDGSLFPFVSSFALIRLHGRTIGGTHVFEDATSIKKMQQLKSNFVALASHQLKTPVGEIQGYVENMIQGLTGPLSAKQLEYLQSIDEITVHSIKLITDLLDITVIEQGDLQIDLHSVPLAKVIKNGLEIYEERLTQKGLKINVVKPDKPITVWADGTKMVEVFGNVLANAVSYTKRNTEIIVETKQVKGFGQILVSDKGRGMSQKVIDSIFQKDNVLSAAPEAEGGTGIGLYLAKQLMSLQKGDISVISSSDTGTTICIKIPLGGKQHDRSN